MNKEEILNIKLNLVISLLVQKGIISEEEINTYLDYMVKNESQVKVKKIKKLSERLGID